MTQTIVQFASIFTKVQKKIDTNVVQFVLD